MSRRYNRIRIPNKSRKTSEQWAGLGILRFFETQCLKPSMKWAFFFSRPNGRGFFPRTFRDWSTSYYFAVTMASIYVGELRSAPPMAPLEWPLFECPSVTSISVDGASEAGGRDQFLAQEVTRRGWLSTTKFNPKNVTFSGPFKERT